MYIQKGDYIEVTGGEFKGEIGIVKREYENRQDVVMVYIMGIQMIIEKDNLKLIS